MDINQVENKAINTNDKCNMNAMSFNVYFLKNTLLSDVRLGEK